MNIGGARSGWTKLGPPPPPRLRGQTWSWIANDGHLSEGNFRSCLGLQFVQAVIVIIQPRSIISMFEEINHSLCMFEQHLRSIYHKGWLAIAKLKPLSLLISLLSMLKKAFDNVKIKK